MSERLTQLSRIKDDLESYMEQFCPCSSGGEYTDASGEKCNDAFLMLQEALRDLKAGT